MSIVRIWAKDYVGFESLSDIERDVSEALDERFNPAAKLLPGVFEGTLRVTFDYIIWEKENENIGT